MKMENDDFISNDAITVKEMRRRYPEGNFKVIGEFIGKKPLDENEGFQVMLANGVNITTKNTGEYKRYKYKVISYLSVNEDEYVAVLKRTWKIPIVVLALLVALILGGYSIWKSNQGPDIDPSIKDYVSELKRPEDLDETQILVPGLTTLVMEADTDIISNTTLFNPDKNPCYFQFTIVDDKNNELYKSRLVPPGKGITNAQLNKKFSEGTYEVTIKIATYDLNDYKTEFNGAEIESKIKALK